MNHHEIKLFLNQLMKEKKEVVFFTRLDYALMGAMGGNPEIIVDILVELMHQDENIRDVFTRAYVKYKKQEFNKKQNHETND